MSGDPGGGGQGSQCGVSLVNAQSFGKIQHWPKPDIPQLLMLNSFFEQLPSGAHSALLLQVFAPDWHSRSVLAAMPYCWRNTSLKYVM